ncbi:hypothetical protein AB9P05_05380 [Roseivirga sp. BDSF3-8]|uniref:hypothetical protein n=1 Tax=Roseivirga sp. BDSF3-8 TaxID=3241598 RepID=UPI0035321B63
MKFLRILIGITFVLILLQGYGYINLTVSEKYETDKSIVELSELSHDAKQERLEEIEARQNEINKQKQIALTTVAFLTVVFIVLVFFLLKNGNKA